MRQQSFATTGPTNLRKWPFFFNGLAVVLALTVGGNSMAEKVRIMPMGDSLTRGYSGPPGFRTSYRRFLEVQFIENNFPYDFVGQYNFGGEEDADHQGGDGMTIQMMTEQHAEAVAEYQPEIVLLLAGTNNIRDQPIVDEFVTKYSDLVDMIRTNSPNARIVMSTVPKLGCCRTDRAYWTEAWVALRNEHILPAMNDAIRVLASQRDYVSAVDLFEILDPQEDLFDDRVHPNRNANTKIANLFFDAVYVVGDANLDGTFDSKDLVRMLQSGEFEDGIENNSTWREGDFTGDGEFDTSDLQLAFAEARYQTGEVRVLGDFNADGVIDLFDIDELLSQVAGQENDVSYDLNNDQVVDLADIRNWVGEIKSTWIGDTDLDGEFNSADLVRVFEAQAENEGLAKSTWATGDWNADAKFDSSDLVLAFQDGGFEVGPRIQSHSVPEPTSSILLPLVFWMLIASSRRSVYQGRDAGQPASGG